MLFDKKNICVIYFIKKHRISAKLNPWVCTEKNLNDMSILEGAKCGKIRTRKKPVLGHFSRSGDLSVI